MALQGNLETFELTSVLQLLESEKKTGMLELKDGEREVRIYVDNGSIIYATGNIDECRLGHFLKKKGTIPKDQLSECLAVAKDQKVSIGKVLVDKGYVSVEKLTSFVYEQIEELLFKLFTWGQADFVYKDGGLNASRIVITRLNVMKMVLNASRRIDEMSVMSKKIASDNLVFKISDEVHQTEQIKLDANEWRVLRLVNGERTVKAIVEKSQYDRFAIYKILYSFITSGLIEEERLSTDKTPDLMESYETIILAYCEVISAVYKGLKNELGVGANEIIDDCKSQSPSTSKELFMGYHPDKPTHDNVQNLKLRLKSFKNLEEGFRALIGFMKDLIVDALDKTTDILGYGLAQSMIKDIKTVLEIQVPQKNPSKEQKEMLEDMATLLKNVQGGIEVKEGR
jgi:hypothetical protein